MHLSAVIPLLNEEATLGTLNDELNEVAAQNSYDLQIIYVDDGSTDSSWAKITELAATDSNVLGIRFRRNFGKAAALSAGFEAATAPIIVTLDADLQDDPQELPKLISKLEQDQDVVSGWKQNRQDPLDKTMPSKVFNWLVSKITGVKLHDHNCGLKCYRREVLNEVRLYGELHRFVPVLAAAKGFRIGEVPVNHRPREFGESKYGAERIIKGLLDLLTVKFITGYGHRPQHLLGTAGLLSFLFGSFGMVWLAVQWCVSRLVTGMEPLHLHQTAALFYCLGLMLVGAQFLSIGLLGEMITAFLSRDADTYSIAEHTSPDKLSGQENSAESSTATTTTTSSADQ